MVPKRPFRLLVKRLCLFFLTMYFVALSLWVTGNLHSFLDSTQALLLGVLSWDSIFLFLFSLLGTIGVVAFPTGDDRRTRTRHALLGLGGYILLLAVGAFGAVFGDAILTLAAGIR